MIAVLAGGQSSERIVSLRSGKNVLEALSQLGYDASFVDYNRDSISSWEGNECQLVFIALHGGDGENGILQKILEEKNLPYTGSDSTSSQLFFNKITTKDFFKSLDIKTPDHSVIDLKKKPFSSPESAFPLIVKSPCQGSSLSVSLVFESRDYQKALEQVSLYDSIALVETFISGREMTLSCVGSEILPLIEIFPSEVFFNNTAKQSSRTRYVCDPLLTTKEKKNIDNMIKKVLESKVLKGFFRIDFILSHSEPVVLEVNTVPGLTKTSLLTKAYCHNGRSFKDFCTAVLENQWKSRL